MFAPTFSGVTRASQETRIFSPNSNPLHMRDKRRCTTIYIRLPQVELLGRVVGEEKLELLRHATAVVVPSVWYETFSFAALESLAAGTPVVASNLGSLPYVVEDGKSGLLFQARDGQDLREKLAWMVQHPAEALQMGRYGRQLWNGVIQPQLIMRCLLEYIRRCKNEIGSSIMARDL